MSSARRLASIVALAAGALLAVAFHGFAQDGAKPAPAKPGAPAQAAPAGDAKKAEVIVPFFGNEKCPMSGKAVNHEKSLEVDGQRVYFCCKDCLAKAKSSSKADQSALVASAYKEVKAVGNKTCPVSGKAIEAGKGKEETWQGHKVTLCCPNCEKAFQKEPMVVLTIATYGCTDLKNAKCPVQNDQAAGADNLVVYKGQLVRLCCDDCPRDFAKEPDKFLKAAGGK
jgi:YHS domain-containing protein